MLPVVLRAYPRQASFQADTSTDDRSALRHAARAFATRARHHQECEMLSMNATACCRLAAAYAICTSMKATLRVSTCIRKQWLSARM